MDEKQTHKSVLLDESICSLEIKPNNYCVDLTVGEGGHSSQVIKKLNKNGFFLGLDLDSKALDAARTHLNNFGSNVHFINQNFRNLVSVLDTLGVKKVDKIIADLGWGSHQLFSNRGFSFKENAPLNMCYSQDESQCLFTAKEIVNKWDEENLMQIFRSYGEERWASRIARKIIFRREEKEIETSQELAEIVKLAIPGKFHSKGRHPATKVFQALRITVNDEIRALEEFLGFAKDLMNPGGRIAIISFHSIEDRIVKRKFRSWEDDGFGKRYSKKPLIPSEEEVIDNPRSRSAKLRTFIFN